MLSNNTKKKKLKIYKPQNFITSLFYTFWPLGHGPKYFVLVFRERVDTSEEIRRAGYT
jgi:hypothetical protein